MLGALEPDRSHHEPAGHLSARLVEAGDHHGLAGSHRRQLPEEGEVAPVLLKADGLVSLAKAIRGRLHSPCWLRFEGGGASIEGVDGGPGLLPMDPADYPPWEDAVPAFDESGQTPCARGFPPRGWRQVAEVGRLLGLGCTRIQESRDTHGPTRVDLYRFPEVLRGTHTDTATVVISPQRLPPFGLADWLS